MAKGMKKSEKTNSRNAFEKGLKVIKEISGKDFKDLKSSRSKLVKTIASSNLTIAIDKNTVEIDPDVLFHRICVVKKNDKEMRDFYGMNYHPFLKLTSTHLEC